MVKKCITILELFETVFFALCFCLEEAGHQVCNKSAITVKNLFEDLSEVIMSFAPFIY